MLYLSLIKTKWLISICICSHCGTGALNFLPIQILCTNFIGMPSSVLNTMATNLSDSSMSRGPQVRRCMVGTTGLCHVRSVFLLHFNVSPSQFFQQTEFLSVSFCMQTRQSYRHLGLRRATPFLPAVQIYLLSWGTEKMLKGDVWLAGCPLWVCWHPQKSSITTTN